MRNDYFILWNGLDGPVRLDLDHPEDAPADVNHLYFARALRYMENVAPAIEGRTFYLVFSHFDALPSYGDDVIVLLMSNETNRLPAYIGRIGVLLQCHRAWPELDPFTTSTRLNALAALRFARNATQWAADWARRDRDAPARHLTPQFDIPLGYGRQEKRPIKPIAEREIDVAFMGSVDHRSEARDSLTSWVKSPPHLPTPKTLARQQMIDALYAARDRLGLNVRLKLTGSYQESWESSSASYSETLMNTKVCLAPRGAAIETNRYFEGLRYGCAVITGPLPDRWFYRGGPAIELPGWDVLPNVLKALLSGSRALEEKHRASLRWWRGKCSKEALGHFIAARLKENAPRPLRSRRGRRPAAPTGSPRATRELNENIASPKKMHF